MSKEKNALFDDVDFTLLINVAIVHSKILEGLKNWMAETSLIKKSSFEETKQVVIP